MMSDIRVAAPEQPRIRPAFTVQKLEGKVSRTIYDTDPKTGKRTERSVEFDAGYLVTMYKGHSIRVLDDKHLKRLGFDKTIPLINNDGDEVGSIPNPVNS
jgi:hypothetical protein